MRQEKAILLAGQEGLTTSASAVVQMDMAPQMDKAFTKVTAVMAVLVHWLQSTGPQAGQQQICHIWQRKNSVLDLGALSSCWVHRPAHNWAELCLRMSLFHSAQMKEGKSLDMSLKLWGLLRVLNWFRGRTVIPVLLKRRNWYLCNGNSYPLQSLWVFFSFHL